MYNIFVELNMFFICLSIVELNMFFICLSIAIAEGEGICRFTKTTITIDLQFSAFFYRFRHYAIILSVLSIASYCHNSYHDIP